MKEEIMSGEESLLIIQKMINTAKKEQRDDGKGWIIWGWLLFLASIFTWINMQLKWLSTFFFWNAFGLVTLVWLAFVIIRFFFFRRPEKVRTYSSDLFSKLNVGYFISLAFIIAAMNKAHLSPVTGFSFLINLYGFWVLIYGTALNFRPSVIGSFLVWGFGFASLFVKGFDEIMIVHALAVLSGYIIPGHLANREFKKLKAE